jgi:hypothetical protein
MEFGKDFGFVLEEKDPSELRVVINKTHIIIISPN